MMLWISLTALVTVVALVLTVPLVRRLETPDADARYRLKVSRQQLAEVEADAARGALGKTEAEEARAEIERRVLADVKSVDGRDWKQSENRTRLIGLAIVTGWVVLGATGLYALIGHPDLPGQPRSHAQVAETATPEEQTAAAVEGVQTAGGVEEMIAALHDRLSETPDDAEGWRMLGWSYFNTERYADAADAYGKAVALDGSDPDVWSAYGEVLVRAARGLVSDDALAAFDQALRLNPGDPRAHFFNGMAKEQNGDVDGALDTWIALANSAPEEADWLPGVLDRIEELAAASNIDLDDRLESFGRTPLSSADRLMPPALTTDTRRGPSAADIAAAADMTPEGRQAMIVGMVEGLAARLSDNPDDPQGWAKLINARMVLNDPDAASAAFDQARIAFSNAPDKLAIVVAAAQQAGLVTN